MTTTPEAEALRLLLEVGRTQVAWSHIADGGMGDESEAYNAMLDVRFAAQDWANAEYLRRKAEHTDALLFGPLSA